MADSVRDYGPAAPHGPNMTGRHVATENIHDMNPNEKGIFDYILLPDDSYENGTYWADMPLGKRVGFINKVNNAEAKREFGAFLEMVKRDPLAPIPWYFHNMVIPGAGLLLEGYVLFSIGNLKPLFEAAFPECWDDHTICSGTWIAAVDYLEIVGIICGQILVGVLGDWIGRRWGLIQDSIIMFIGLVMLTVAWGINQNGWVICYVWSLWFYGVGVGGEYPMTATAGMENAVGSGKISTREDRLHRGRKVTGAFLMQGWGQFFNQVLLILLLLVIHGTGNPPYGEVSTQWVYRLSFAFPALGTLWLVYYRTYKMKAAGKQLQLAKKKAHVTGYDVRSLQLTFTYFGPRMIATCGGWYCNDVFFYGNKLFQGEFIAILTNGTDSVMVGWLYNLINVGCALVGYYLASFFIDHKLYGRKWMQVMGFSLDFILFVVPAFAYNYYTEPQHIHSFQAMYFLSSFWNQFGPNSVTFIVAAEVYPTPIRATAHGISAASGKLGALTAAILYNYITTTQIFHVVPWFGLGGALLTILFLPDTTGLDLKEQERRWNYIRAGREHEYHGVSIHPSHLSLWERFRGVGRQYDPVADYDAKLNELRGEWEEWQAAKATEKDGEAYDHHDADAEQVFGSDVSSYFARTAPGSVREKPLEEELAPNGGSYDTT